jgi:hypothetical protein
MHCLSKLLHPRLGTAAIEVDHMLVLARLNDRDKLEHHIGAPGVRQADTRRTGTTPR